VEVALADSERRIALLLDYENLAIGARESGIRLDMGPISDALASRGRVVVRRAYADWNQFSEDRRMLAQWNVELIEVPQRLGATRKNAADIKLAVDAIESTFERSYIDTFAIGTGDSDFTPLVQKLRELNRHVIGIGLHASTSALLPPACDEFLYYERLNGVEQLSSPRESRTAAKTGAPGSATSDSAGDDRTLIDSVTSTLAALKGSENEAVHASTLKRAMLRRDSTFSETDYGFRGFGELLRHLQDRNVVELSEGPARGDPEVDFPVKGDEERAFKALRDTVAELQGRNRRVLLTSLKNELLRRDPNFDEKVYGYAGFLQFCRAARARRYVEIEWDGDARDYLVTPPAPG
jgi:uncharacterized protein (TIGR00288 family)